MSAFLVVGSTGEYSDAQEWQVCAYDNANGACDHMRKANRWLRRVGIHATSESAHRRYYGVGDGPRSRDLTNPYDPGMNVDYTGVDYHVVVVPLLSNQRARQGIPAEHPVETIREAGDDE